MPTTTTSFYHMIGTAMHCAGDVPTSAMVRPGYISVSPPTTGETFNVEKNNLTETVMVLTNQDHCSTFEHDHPVVFMWNCERKERDGRGEMCVRHETQPKERNPPAHR